MSAPHIYDLSKIITPGEHTLTLRIDNRIKEIDPGRDAHSISDNTQTNWNGIIGDMKLVSRPLVYISEVQLYPDVDKKIVRVNVTVTNLTNDESDYQLQLEASPINVSPLTKVEPPYQKYSHQQGYHTDHSGISNGREALVSGTNSIPTFIR